MARPKKTKVLLDKMIAIRVDAETLATWRRHAELAGLPLGEWARLRIAGSKEPRRRPRRDPPAADPKLLAGIARAGNNLNQIARAGNMKKLPEQIELLEQLVSIERALLDLVPPKW